MLHHKKKGMGKNRIRHFRSIKQQGEGRGGMAKENVTSTDNLNDEDLVIVNNCNACPGDSAGVEYKGRCKCMCTHTKEPVRKNKECPRHTVDMEGATSSEGTNSSHYSTHSVRVIPVDILIDRKTNASSIGIDSMNNLHGHHLGREGTPLNHQIILGLIATLFLCCFTAVIIVGLYIIRQQRSKRRHRRLSSRKMEMKSAGIFSPDSVSFETTCTDLAVSIYSSEEITNLVQIGQGCFGKVFKGDLNGEILAIKMIRSEHSGEALREIEAMASFSHPNILPLLGIAKCAEADSPWLLFEFMEHGDLASVLRLSSGSKPSVSSEISQTLRKADATNIEIEEKEQFKLTYDLLEQVAEQIAEGMTYLASQHFVHRDVAARNCLVSASGIVKISDFGMSRDVYTTDYYKVGGCKLLPIRWMAPESILYGCFTLESDVWAYGTILWEIYTWGKQPYYGHSNEEVIQLILDGVLLSPPRECPRMIQEIMASCWKTDSKFRPTFSEILSRFRSASRIPPDEINNVHKEIDDYVGLSTTSNIMDESDYEIPRTINHLEYLLVV